VSSGFLKNCIVVREAHLNPEFIIQTVPVEQIWLFGSYAYGTPHKDSDLDSYKAA